MATSTFSKHIELPTKKVKSFMQEMTRTVTPTLTKNFHSQSVHLSQDNELKEQLKQALNK